MIIGPKLKSNQISNTVFGRLYFGSALIILSACGNDKSNVVSEISFTGLSPDYVPPQINYDAPNMVDGNFKKLEPLIEEPYWVKALEMDAGERDISLLLMEHDRMITFSFPSAAPVYLPLTISGWAPANQSMVFATREIFTNIGKILDIRIEENEIAEGLNNFAISQSIQVGVAGFSYYPNNFFEVGSDIFISKDYSSPQFFLNGLTNYDYEVLVHEIGHALGLKHPFEGDRNNQSILNANEDQTIFTAMSYTHDSSTFDGIFRPLDWMTLTKLYGVNPKFNNADNFYTFDNNKATFIIDGNGVDTITALGSSKSIYIDLRPGTHSYEGQKSNFITSSNQLSISHGSDLENAITGSGDDTIIGNFLPNEIIAAAGDDDIFAGEGSDIIHPGSGNDTIDLSEDVQATDKIVLEISDIENIDTVYGFIQGVSGDVIDLTSFGLIDLKLVASIDVLNVPLGYIDNCVVRVSGQNLTDQKGLGSQFNNEGSLQNLNISNDNSSIFITANSQDTGENQNIFNVSNYDGFINVTHLLCLSGNYLDLDSWHSSNFLV